MVEVEGPILSPCLSLALSLLKKDGILITEILSETMNIIALADFGVRNR